MTPVERAGPDRLALRARRAGAPEARDHPGERLLGFGADGLRPQPLGLGRPAEAAANLFGHLHDLDARGSGPIAVAPIPETGLGLAINDRLRRAAAPRPGDGG